jgi:hypothetical protein
MAPFWAVFNASSFRNRGMPSRGKIQSNPHRRHQLAFDMIHPIASSSFAYLTERRESMSRKNLMTTMERLTKQLKGAPLRDFEKNQLEASFDANTGDAFDRAKSAVLDVLHTYPEYIEEKSEVLEDVENMVEEMKQAAAAYSE